MKQKRPISGSCASVHFCSAFVHGHSSQADQGGSKETLSEYKKNKKQKTNQTINTNLYTLFFSLPSLLLRDTESLHCRWAAVPSWELGREFGSQPAKMRHDITRRSCNFTNLCKWKKKKTPTNEIVQERCQELKSLQRSLHVPAFGWFLSW